MRERNEARTRDPVNKPHTRIVALASISIFDVEEVANAFIRGQKHGHGYGARGAETSDARSPLALRKKQGRGERQRKGIFALRH